MEATNETGKNPAGAQSRGAEGGTNLSVLLEGISTRDYFAGLAMQGLLSFHGAYCDDSYHAGGGSDEALDVDTLAEYSYIQADAMMMARALPSNAEITGSALLKESE